VKYDFRDSCHSPRMKPFSEFKNLSAATLIVFGLASVSLRGAPEVKGEAGSAAVVHAEMAPQARVLSLIHI
jgi:hypothetical protein